MRSRPLLSTVLVLGIALAAPLSAQRGGCRDQPASGPTIRVASEQEPGQRLVVAGRVLDASGAPVGGMRVAAAQSPFR